MAPDLRAQIRDSAERLGACAVGIAAVEPLAEAEQALGRWLAAGMHGEMGYLAGPGRRAHPADLLPGAKSAIVVALPHGGEPRRAGPDEGLVSRYALGADYHPLLRQVLGELATRCVELAQRPVSTRACVDTAPLLERALAARGGLGFIGKNGLVIAPGRGSYLLLGELLTDLELVPDEPQTGGCGECTACLEVCPTAALVAPFVLDARRCISYLTIELRGGIPPGLRAAMGRAVCGCDLCQEVCPHNHKLRPGLPALRARGPAPKLVELLALGSAAHKRLVRGTALARLSRNQLARNAAVALGNSGDRQFAAPLATALATHPSALVRGHAAWALGRLGGEMAQRALGAASADPDPGVRGEVALARGA